MFLLLKNDAIAIIPVIILVIGTILFVSYYFSAKQVILRKLAKTPIKSSSGIQTNAFVKVHGKALHVKEPLIAPLSGRKCIFYKLKIEKQVSNGKSAHWKTIHSEENFQEFFVDSRGDYVIVRPTKKPKKNYKSYLIKDKKMSSGAFKSPSPEFESILRNYGIDPQGLFGFNKTLRAFEGIIEVGETITVGGVAKWKNLSEPIEGYPYSRIAELVSDNNQQLYITDDPKALKRGKRMK